MTQEVEWQVCKSCDGYGEGVPPFAGYDKGICVVCNGAGKVKFTHSSGNVFADLGLENAEELQVEALFTIEKRRQRKLGYRLRKWFRLGGRE